MNDIKWVNQFQPQTLVIATILLYIDAFFWLINLTRGFPAEVAAVAMLSMAIGGWGIANEKKWGYAVALGGAVLQVVMLFVWYGSSVFTSTLLISLLFDGALVALLVHPMSREYQRIWFK